MFVESPAKFYHSEKECMKVAEKKSRNLIDSHIKYGYTIESNAHSCEFIPSLDTI